MARLVRTTLLLVSAAVGGCAGALLWVAQGVYFTRNAGAYDEAAEALHAKCTNRPSTRANSRLIVSEARMPIAAA